MLSSSHIDAPAVFFPEAQAPNAAARACRSAASASTRPWRWLQPTTEQAPPEVVVRPESRSMGLHGPLHKDG